MTTMTMIPIDAVATQHLISLFTLRTIGARDLVIDDTGVFAFFYGKTGRVQIRLTGTDVYLVEVGHVDRRTFEWVIDRWQNDVAASDLREVLQELT
jgi:hypothetical protein